MSGTIEDRIYDLVCPLIESMGATLWGIRYKTSHTRALLQIFIEHEDGVSADLCGDITHVLSPALDAADIIAPAYTLEVSSPGLDRILFTLDQVRDYKDHTLRAELRIPFMGRRKLEGLLLSVSDDGTLVIDDKDQGQMEIAFANVSLLRVVPKFKTNTVPKAAKAHK